MANRIQYRRDTKANWLKYNPVLMEGEVGYETDTHHQKVGDGVSTYSELEYEGGVGNITQETGDSETLAMSQKAVTEKLTELEGKLGVYIMQYDTDFSTMRKKIPTNFRKNGVTLIFQETSTGPIIMQQYVGQYTSDTHWLQDKNWSDLNNQRVFYCGNLSDYTNISTLRDTIQTPYRKQGTIIIYNDNNELSAYMYIGTSIAYAEFCSKSSNWRKIAFIDEVYTKEENDTVIDTSINATMYDLKLSEWGVSLK